MTKPDPTIDNLMASIRNVIAEDQQVKPQVDEKVPTMGDIMGSIRKLQEGPEASLADQELWCLKDIAHYAGYMKENRDSVSFANSMIDNGLDFLRKARKGMGRPYDQRIDSTRPLKGPSFDAGPETSKIELLYAVAHEAAIYRSSFFLMRNPERLFAAVERYREFVMTLEEGNEGPKIPGIRM